MGIKTNFQPLGGGLSLKPFKKVFNYTGEFIVFRVPAKTYEILVECFGSQGFNGAKGGKVSCSLKVTPGQSLYIYVGGYATSADNLIYNASDIRLSNEGVVENTSLSNRLVVAGAGGAYRGGYTAGVGGGITGGTGSQDIIHGGRGGTQTAGGARSGNIRGSVQGTANWGNNGEFGLGGYGVACGGSGWFGGGTCYVSKAGTQNSGGGGGSSYTDATLCTDVVHTQGVNSGAGSVIIKSLDYIGE
ncbi:MAG: glycine-rich protein [Alphaproteobacteria bacterium]